MLCWRRRRLGYQHIKKFVNLLQYYIYHLTTCFITAHGTPNMANNSTTSSQTADALSTSEVITKSDYMKYLTSYESMVRQQDIEFTATSEHMQLLFKRIQTLGCKKKSSDSERLDKNSRDSPPSGMLTYLQIRRCLLRMGIGWNKSSSNNNNGDYDDDVSVLSFNSTASFTSGLSGGTRSDIIATDAQLIMLLTTLVEMEEVYRTTGSKKDGYSPPRRGKKSKQYQLDQGLFLPEFIQCYEIIIGGMNSLKSATTTANSSSKESTFLCTRLKERTMSMLRPFGPDSRLYNDTLREKNSTLSLSPVKGSWRSSVKSSSTPSKRSKSGFSNKEMKKVMRSKDVTLAKIMEEHESEMDMLAVSLEELRLKEQRARNALKKRRRRAIVCAILFICLIIGIGIRVETYQRKSLESEMTAEQKEERLKDLATIAQLKEKKQALEKELGVLDGKRRYQVNRNNDIESQTFDTKKKIDELDVKWLLDKAETERCFISQAKMKQELAVEKLKTTEVDEEAAWCQSQLQSREKEMNELKHVSSGKSIVSSSDDDTKKGLMSFPKSIRKNIILRQVYSAAGGAAVSVLLQVVAPSALKLFLPRAVLPPVVPDYRRMEMAIVDGIFGSQIALLLYRAVAVFLAPL